MNLAPLRYARVMSRHNGPLERIDYSRTEVLGRNLCQARAYLSRHLNLRKEKPQLFSDADGTGTHSSALVARHMAISEAMERWALYYLDRIGHGEAYGLDRDPTSTGMAAYPGLFARAARKRALAEAAERFCLVAWWNGELPEAQLPVRERDVEAIEIANPASGDHVVLVWKKGRHGTWAYGYAADRKLGRARDKAVIEMERANTALGSFFADNPGFEAGDLETVHHPQERRILFFALPEGHRLFQKHLRRKKRDAYHTDALKPLVDTRLYGPWDRYAIVWRVLFPMPTRDYLGPDTEVFFW